ncbi:hypothetical protein HR060_09515 [Catenovulum sp. SM1970]|uniref:hypothetical protein n=1 Tax=Marinifaba aquimaris TaxID=2741323 RepID=UPI001574392F|nr:hypothetical protein [Marinifaba aquimaris]NTS77110.1 hypothetical protein [Marinifaba aquimaris]
MVNLDFATFPVIEEGSVFWKLPNDALKVIPDVYEKAVAAQYMLFKMSEEPKSQNVPLQISARAHFRASLVEFAGIEEALIRNGYDFKIRKLPNPALHLLRLLRNYQVHFSSINFGNKDIDIIWNSENHSINVLVIDNITVQGLSELDAVKRYKNYSTEQLENMVAHFNEQQSKLGVYQFVLTCMNLYLTDVERLITSN